jgi:methanogenic corrinoid protein MtbC1
MTSNEKLAAMMIQASAGTLAGFAAAEIVGNGDNSHGDFDLWKAYSEQRLLELCAALDFEEPELLADELRWSRSAFGIRGLPIEKLAQSIDILGSVLEEQLSSPAAESALSFLNRAKTGLQGEEPKTSRLDASNEQDRLALSYLERALSGDRRGAIEMLLERIDGTVDAMDIYEQALIPAQREIGEMWHAGELSVAEEHVCSATTQRAMSVLVQHAVAASDRGAALNSGQGTVLAATAAGNIHDMASRVLADFFEMSGWRAILIGKDIPASELARGIEAFDVDLLLLSATLTVHLPTLQQTIEIVRKSTPDRQLRVLVGGRAFRAVPELWRKVGADGYASSAREALGVAAQMFAN